MVKEILARIQTAIEEEFPIFQSALNDLEDELLRRPEEITMALPLKDDTPSVIPDFLKKISEMPVMKKIMIAPLAPVLLIGFVGRLPYVGYKHFERFIDLKLWRRYGEYQTAEGSAKRANVCTKYAKHVFNMHTDRVALEAIIKNELNILLALLNKQETKMKDKIEADKRLIAQLEADSRAEETVKRLYEPLQNKFEQMNIQLRYFLTKYFPDLTTDLPFVTANNVKVKDTVICSGVEAEIRLGEGKFVLQDSATNQTIGHELRQICVRVQKKRVQITDIEKHRVILKEYR